MDAKLICILLVLAIVFSSLGYSQLAMPQTSGTDPVFTLDPTLLGVTQGNFYCGALDFSPDVNNDGYMEILVGFPAMRQVFMADGKTGSAIHTINGDISSTAFGASMMPLNDINGNGLADFAVGDTSTISPLNNNDGSVYVYDGSGALLYQVFGTSAGEAFGTALANMGDITNDGVDDFAVSALASSRVYVFNGATGQSVYPPIIYTPWAISAFGSALANVGDVDNDGINDVAVGAPMVSSAGWTMLNNGAVYIYSGANGALINSLFGYVSAQNFGRSLVSADITGDGMKELIVGASYANSLQGTAYVYSGSAFNLLTQITGSSSGTLFGSTLAAGDLNMDGFNDLVVGHSSTGLVYSFHGPGATASYNYGDSAMAPVLVASGDYNTDGFDDILVCDQNSGLRVYSEGGVYVYGEGPGQLGFSWTPNQVISSTVVNPATGLATITGGQPNGQGYVAASYASALIQMLGGNVLIDPSPANLFPIIPFVFDANGNAVFPMGLQSSVPGTKLHLQVVSETQPGSYTFSPGVQIRLV